MSNQNNNYSQWTHIPNIGIKPVAATIEKIPAGSYKAKDAGQYGLVLDPMVVTTDELTSQVNPEIHSVLNEIEGFWKKAEQYKKFGFLHKRGILMYGIPGTGKTSAIQILAKRMHELDGIVMYYNSDIDEMVEVLKNIRSVEPDRPIMCVFEDLHDITGNGWESRSILSYLDGENSINHVLNIATTNTAGKLDKRFVGRHRRFDLCVNVVAPNVLTRKHFLMKTCAMEEELADKYALATEGMSFGSLADVVIRAECLGEGFEKALTTVKESSTLVKTESIDLDNDEV